MKIVMSCLLSHFVPGLGNWYAVPQHPLYQGLYQRTDTALNRKARAVSVLMYRFID